MDEAITRLNQAVAALVDERTRLLEEARVRREQEKADSERRFQEYAAEQSRALEELRAEVRKLLADKKR